MKREELIKQIRKKSSFLCVGLDPDEVKMPGHMKDHPDAIYAFCKAIVDATEKYCVAFKPNSAFFEAMGTRGWDALERIVHYIKTTYPEQFVIADAKRGDIGNTSAMYAKAFLESMGADAITVAPYMGEDSVRPFILPGKWVVLLALTSNPGAADLQLPELYKQVLQKARTWGSKDNLMFVIGATRAEMLKEIRNIIPDHFLLVPGIGAQGGSLEDVVKFGMNKDVGILVNASRSILYASSGSDFAEKAAAEAMLLQKKMAKLF